MPSPAPVSSACALNVRAAPGARVSRTPSPGGRPRSSVPVMTTAADASVRYTRHRSVHFMVEGPER